VNSFSWSDRFGATQRFHPFPRAAGGDQDNQCNEGEGDHGVETPDRGLASNCEDLVASITTAAFLVSRISTSEKSELRVAGKDFQVSSAARGRCDGNRLAGYT
jgi:hypothetical protein